jgi:hypothetical protein
VVAKRGTSAAGALSDGHQGATMRPFVICIALLAASASLAQRVEPVGEVRYQRRTLHDFSTLNVEGHRMRPDAGYIHTRKKTSFRNMIQLRGHFRAEMLESAKAL